MEKLFAEFEKEEIDELSALNNVELPSNSLILTETIKNSPELTGLYNALNTYLNFYIALEDYEKNPKQLAAINGLVQYSLQSKGILPIKISASYKHKNSI